MAFVAAAFTGLLQQAFFRLLSAQIGGHLWAALHPALHRSPRSNAVAVQRYLALCRSQSQPL